MQDPEKRSSSIPSARAADEHVGDKASVWASARQTLVSDDQQQPGLGVLLFDGCRGDAEADRDRSDFC